MNNSLINKEDVPSKEKALEIAKKVIGIFDKTIDFGAATDFGLDENAEDFDVEN